MRVGDEVVQRVRLASAVVYPCRHSELVALGKEGIRQAQRVRGEKVLEVPAGCIYVRQVVRADGLGQAMAAGSYTGVGIDADDDRARRVRSK